MATVMQRICDICASAGRQTAATDSPLTIGLGPAVHEADLCAHDQDQLLAGLAPFIAASRPLSAPPKIDPHRDKVGRKKPPPRLPDSECPKCHRKMQKTGLNVHSRTCIGPMPVGGYPCPECGETFRIVGQWHRHRAEAHNVVPEHFTFICEHCGKPYAFEYRFIAHLEQEHPEAVASTQKELVSAPV